MTRDEEDRDQESGSGDLFEDLDKFFAPVEETEWSEAEKPPGTPPPAEGPAEAAEGPGGEGGDEGPGEREGPETAAEPPITGGFEEPIWPVATGEEEMATGEGETGPGDEEMATGEAEVSAGEEEAAGPGEAPLGSEESTRAEMSGRDWTRLRDVLGDEEEEEEFGFPSGDVPADETLYGYGSGRQDEMEEEAATGDDDTGRIDLTEQPGDITVDDLKQPPVEYAGLPRAEDKERMEPVQPEEPEAEEPADEFAGTTAGTEGAEDFWGGSTGDAAREEEERGVEEGAWREPSGEVEERWREPSEDRWREPSEERWREPSEEVEEDLLSDLDSAEPRRVRVGSEPLTGPTWEEPTSRAIMSEPSGGPSGIPSRNLPAAVLSAVILAVVAVIALMLKRWMFAVVAVLVVLLGQAELYATMQRRNYQPATALGLVLGGMTMAAGYFKGEQAMLFVVGFGLILTLLWYMAAVPKARAGMVGNVGATMLGLVYVPFLAGYVLVIETLASGRALVAAVLGLPILYDIAAMFFGSFWGSRPLAPTISPKKSWEGLLGATIVTFAVSIAFVPIIDAFSVTKAIGLALLVVIFAPLGDLAESAIKRDLGVKDMGTIIPGHGGVLDRIDSLLFVAPAAFYFFRIIFR